MNLEQQVCSLELAKRLKELGVKQESVFWYWGTQEKFDRGRGYAGPSIDRHSRMVNISAFTVAELGEMLPTDVLIDGSVAWFDTRHDQKGSWVVSYDYETDCVAFHGSEADARAKMLIYLLENKLIVL